MFIYTKLKLEDKSANLIKSKMNAVGLEHIVDTLKGNCDCKTLEAHELHITMKSTAATSIDHIKQALLPYPTIYQHELDNLGLSPRSIEKWNEKYTAFHKLEMPKKLCEKLLYSVQNIVLKVDDYSAHFGRFAAITLNAIDQKGTASHLNNNPHISTIKCTGNEASACLSKIDRIGNSNYQSIIDLGIKNTVISVNAIEINADIYGVSHSTIMSKDLASCYDLLKVDDTDIIDPIDEKSNLGSVYIMPDGEQKPVILDSQDNVCLNNICGLEHDFFTDIVDPINTKSDIGRSYTPLDASLGKGYSSISTMVLQQQCFVMGERSEDGRAQSSRIDLKKGDFKEITDALGLDLSINGAYKFLKIPSVNYLKSIKNTQHSISFSFYYINSFPEKTISYNNKIGQDILNDYGKSIYKDRPEQFVKICGDNIVVGVEKSAIFIANIEVILKDKDSKASFELGTDLKDTTKMKSVILALKNNEILKSTLIAVEISAFQKGGSSNALSGILSFNQEKHYHIADCSLLNIDSCLYLIDGILNYVKEFSNQITSDNNDGIVTNFQTQQVTHFLPNLIISEIDSITQGNRRYLHKIYDQLSAYYSKLSKMINSNHFKENIDLDDKKKLSTVHKGTENLIHKLEDEKGATLCYTSLKDCNKITEDIAKEVIKLDYSCVDHLSKIINITVSLYTWNPFLWCSSNILDVMYPYIENGKYLFGSKNANTSVVKAQDNFVINSQNVCPELSKSGGAQYVGYIDEDTTHCLSNWWDSWCNWFSCSGKIIIQETDILGYDI